MRPWVEYPKDIQLGLAPIFALVTVALASLACAGTASVWREGQAPTDTPAEFITSTPGGVISVWLVTPTGMPPGGPSTPTPLALPAQVVAPAATATAIFATYQAATATASAPTSVPTYQPNECPEPGNPHPPMRPDTFSRFPEAIGAYLSAGGPSTLLEVILRDWGAITDEVGLVKADADVTGDGVNEVIILMADPFNLSVAGHPGQLLIFGCDSGGYRLLYAPDYMPYAKVPTLVRVGDMNADRRAEVVFYYEDCGAHTCWQHVFILTWNELIGSFVPLNREPIEFPAGEISIEDVDDDGILELLALHGRIGSVGAGPQRAVTDIWDWNGENYLLAVTEVAPPEYVIHQLHDADEELVARLFNAASSDYLRAINDQELQLWGIPYEREYLTAYALYRLVLTYALAGNHAAAQTHFERLQAEFPPDSPGGGYAQMAAAFWAEFAASGDVSAACAQAKSVALSRPDVLMPLNSFGYANRTYTVDDMCPF